jgi:lipopolysaccharide heptosyltransferase II
MRLLIVLPGALGDVIRALPLLGRIRRAHPDATLGWVVEPLSAPLLDGHPWLDRVHRLERRSGLAAWTAIARELRAARYDDTLDLGRGAKSAALAVASGARRRIGFARADAREGAWLVATERLAPHGVARSKLEQFLAFGAALGATDGPLEFGLAPTDAERARATALLEGLPGPLVAACVGSSCPSRRWGAARTAAVLEALHAAHGTSAVVLGAGADVAFGEAVAARLPGRARNLAGQTTLRDLLAILARARLAFGPDSGALHLAAALGVRVVSLWGATSALRSAPLGSERWVASGRTPCSPCFLARCPIERACMRTIEVREVVGLVEDALAA